MIILLSVYFVIFLLFTRIDSIYLYRLPFIVGVLFSILAFTEVIGEGSDLFEAYEVIEGFRTFGWNYLDKNDLSESAYLEGRYVLQLFLYLVSFLPTNNFYQAIGVFFIYFLPTKASVDYLMCPQKNDFLDRIFILLFICIINFVEVSNGVRNAFAFSICAYVIIEDLLLKNANKKLIYTLYLVAPLIHSAAWVIVLLRVLLFFNRVNEKLILGIIFLWSFFVTFLADLFSAINNNQIVSSILDRIFRYMVDDEDNYNFSEFAYNNSSTYIEAHNYRLILLSILFLLVVMYWKKIKELNHFLLFFLYLLTFSLGAATDFVATNVLNRYTYIILMLLPVTMSTIKNELITENSDLRKNNNIEVFILYGVIVCCLLLAYHALKYYYQNLHFEI